MSDADRYAKIVYWSEEDQCFIGCCPKLVLGGCHGDDPKAVFAELCEIVSEAVELYAKPPMGHFPFSVTSHFNPKCFGQAICCS